MGSEDSSSSWVDLWMAHGNHGHTCLSIQDMLVFSCMGTARQNGKRDARPQGGSRSAEVNGGRPVAVATSSYVNIIEALLENGSMSRSELATSTGLSRSALTEMSRVLIQHQFVEESPSVI